VTLSGGLKAAESGDRAAKLAMNAGKESLNQSDPIKVTSNGFHILLMLQLSIKFDAV